MPGKLQALVCKAVPSKRWLVAACRETYDLPVCLQELLKAKGALQQGAREGTE
jgi:hypothetical protein